MIENSIEMWPIVNDILRREGVARQHLNSYNEFMERGLQSIIDEVGEIEIETAESLISKAWGRSSYSNLE